MDFRPLKVFKDLVVVRLRRLFQELSAEQKNLVWAFLVRAFMFLLVGCLILRTPATVVGIPLLGLVGLGACLVLDVQAYKGLSVLKKDPDSTEVIHSHRAKVLLLVYSGMLYLRNASSAGVLVSLPLFLYLTTEQAFEWRKMLTFLLLALLCLVMRYLRTVGTECLEALAAVRDKLFANLYFAGFLVWSFFILVLNWGFFFALFYMVSFVRSLASLAPAMRMHRHVRAVAESISSKGIPLKEFVRLHAFPKGVAHEADQALIVAQKHFGPIPPSGGRGLGLLAGVAVAYAMYAGVTSHNAHHEHQVLQNERLKVQIKSEEHAFQEHRRIQDQGYYQQKYADAESNRRAADREVTELTNSIWERKKQIAEDDLNRLAWSTSNATRRCLEMRIEHNEALNRDASATLDKQLDTRRFWEAEVFRLRFYASKDLVLKEAPSASSDAPSQTSRKDS